MKISIIGAAGAVGSSTAFNIGIHKIADELVMIGNQSKDKLDNYITDLRTSVTGLDTLVRAGNWEDMQDSNIVIMAAGSLEITKTKTELLTQNLKLIKDTALKVKEYCPKAIVITATNPIDPLNYGMYLAAELDKKQCIGYSTNDSIRFRMFVSEAMKVKSSQVEATVIGEHGASQVPLFSSIKIKGVAVEMNYSQKEWVIEQMANMPKIMESQRMKTGRTQGWTTSMGITAMCKAISQDTREIMPGSVVLDGQYGYRNISISVPVRLGKNGVVDIKELSLTQEERDGLERSVNTVRPFMENTERFLGKK